MPRIGFELERCVFFAFGKDIKKTDEIQGPGGTGFFVCRQSDASPYTWHVYAISNRHVVSDYSWVRINSNDSKAVYWEFEPTDWVWSKTDDLAAVDVTDYIPFSEETGMHGSPISCVLEKDFVSDWFMNSYNVGIGDQTIMLGLFANHNSGEVNTPVGRFGNIAAVPNERSPISLGQTDRFVRPAWLNDTHSRTGFSGSPVWVWRSKYDDLSEFRGFGAGYRPEIPRQSFLGLLGCHRGQFREPTTVWAAESQKILHSGDAVEVASAMTVVVPAWEISRLLDDDRLKAQRAVRDILPERQNYSNSAQKIMRMQEERRQGGQSSADISFPPS